MFELTSICYISRIMATIYENAIIGRDTNDLYSLQIHKSLVYKRF